MRDRIGSSFTVVMFLLLLVSGFGPVATATPRAPTYTIIDLGNPRRRLQRRFGHQLTGPSRGLQHHGRRLLVPRLPLGSG
jgi:hypothetical protein